jgi:probable phosphoglycerate mutase
MSVKVTLKPGTQKVVYFVRHGQSLDNAAPVFQGLDSPLSARGQLQATQIAQRVADIPFEAIISSPLERTKQTAQVIAKATGKDIEFSELFVERRKPSSINGKPYTDAAASHLWHDWEKSMTTPGPGVEDGEGYDDILSRAKAALHSLLQRPERHLLVVTHGYFLRALVTTALLGEALTLASYRSVLKGMAMENTGVTVLVYEDAFEQAPRWRLWVYNDHAHLTAG